MENNSRNQQQISALQESIANLEQAGVDPEMISPLREKLALLESQSTEKDGGNSLASNIGPSSSGFTRYDQIVQALADGSVVIGRDANGNTIITGNNNTINVPPDQLPEILLQAYYRLLSAECGRLPLGILDPEFVTISIKKRDLEKPLSLDSVYTDLDVVSPPQQETEHHHLWGLRLSKGEGDSRTPLLEAIGQEQVRHLVLLGDPGSGKTTFVNYLTAQLTGNTPNDLPESLLGLVPIRLLLRNAATQIPTDAKTGTAEMLWKALQADIVARLGDTAAEKVMPYIQQKLFEKGGLILLDGLDEVPEAGKRRKCLLEAIQSWVSAFPANSRFLLTARPYAYADPKWQIGGFQIIALAPFNARQIEGFINRWYQAVRPGMQWDERTAQEKAAQLRHALDERRDLIELAGRPLLLTLMATLHTHQGKLPEDRADLYENSVKLLLSRWQVQRQVKDLTDPEVERVLNLGEDRLRAALESLAYQTHKRQGQDPTGREEAAQNASADIPLDDVLAAFSKQLPKDITPSILV